MTCQPATVWSHRIPNFKNPVTQRSGGAAYQGVQRWTLNKRTVVAVAIAAQSPVDCADIVLTGAVGGVGRIRVSADRPWFGRLDGESFESLIFEPVRPIDTLSAFTTTAAVDEIHSLQGPDLIVDIYCDGCAPPLLAPRAVNLDSTASEDASTLMRLTLCVAGRREIIGFRWTVADFQGGCTVVHSLLTLTSYAITAAGVLVPVAVTRAGADLAAGQTGELWVAPEAPSVGTLHDSSCQWGYAALQLTPDGGTFDGRIIGEAR